MSEFKQKVIEYVRRVPESKLVYFGMIAEEVGGTAQTVGWLLSGLTAEECEGLPWHRVVAKNGYISALKLGDKGRLQKLLLEEEGFEIIDDRVDIKRFLWSNNKDYDPAESLF